MVSRHCFCRVATYSLLEETDKEREDCSTSLMGKDIIHQEHKRGTFNPTLVMVVVGVVGESFKWYLNLTFEYVKITPSWEVGGGLSIPHRGSSPCEGPALRDEQDLQRTKKKFQMTEVQSLSRERAVWSHEWDSDHAE